jgi:hypothetical protein
VINIGTYVFDIHTKAVYEACVEAKNINEAKKKAKKLFLDEELIVDDEIIISIEPWEVYLDENGETLI